MNLFLKFLSRSLNVVTDILARNPTAQKPLARTFIPGPPLTRALGKSGRSYIVECILQEKPHRQGRVYLAKSEGQKFVLKSVAPHDYKYFEDMFNDLRSSVYVRVFEDTCPEESMFMYRYYRDHLLSFVEKDLPLPITKRILRDILRGIADMHNKGIFHTDIKADNVMIDWTDQEGILDVKQVRIADIEDAAYIPEGKCARGRRLGNWIWRSPEAHTAVRVEKPTDVFSFGIVCIYVVTKDLILQKDKNEILEGSELVKIVLNRQISHFADKEGLEGLIKYLNDSYWAQYFGKIAAELDEKNPSQSFLLRSDIDPDFRDLVGRLTNFDPVRRITANEALEHKWFSDVP